MSQLVNLAGMPVTSQKPATPAAGGSDNSALIMDATEATFVRDVIEASLNGPVVVDFWATWCGPCKQLTPLLEKHVLAAGGAVRLVKVDVDQNPRLVAQLRVQSMPTIYVFYQGQPVDAFQGALPESQVKAFIDRLAQLGGGNTNAADVEAAINQANEALGQGNLEFAAQLFHEALMLQPDAPAAMIGLIRIQLASGDVEGAQNSIDALTDETKKHKDFSALQAALELALQAANNGPLAELEQKAASNIDDLQARYDLAVAQYASGQTEKALNNLLSLVAQNKLWNEDAARKQLLVMFDAIGAADPLVRDARRKLSGMLFK